MRCKNCEAMEQALSQALYERDQARQQAAQAPDIRDQGMRGGILAGDTVDEKKANMVYLLTGKIL